MTGAGGDIGRAIEVKHVALEAQVYAIDCVQESVDDLVGKMSDIIPVYQDLSKCNESAENVDNLLMWTGW